MLLLFISLLVNSIFVSSTGIFMLWYNAIMKLFMQPEIMIFTVFRTSVLMKEISTKSASIGKLNC